MDKRKQISYKKAAISVSLQYLTFLQVPIQESYAGILITVPQMGSVRDLGSVFELSVIFTSSTFT